MAQNIEIEFKNIITKHEFIKLIDHFQLNDNDFFIQENHYFDTADFSLKENGCALRIRQKNDNYELTLKQPHQDGLLETNEALNAGSAEEMFQNGKLSNETIRTLIEKMHINPNAIQYFGSLTTKRAEIEYKQGLVVLDNSFYLNKEDFEIEYEVSNRKKGQSIFAALLLQLEIPIRETENKIKRFYNEKKNQQGRF
ncbi:CYTH domain-containing protein [Bacillus sp. FJAT-29790]|uniref:CYTH domain-containing protein n=1 Tax=Bacillus sp. FJAT-29790 TaxID=1895002 RepID=UPI001C24C2E3|nr:CYTH domain-containing protein [Bacillus sp. FJAT-29790]MBU8877478.1 CYTH domain-containing protein [Bacillus sp. FJAT-29790]